MTIMPLVHLRWLRWAVRAVLVLGITASVAGNVLHAADNPISQTISAWPPLALLLTVELISRVPVHRRALAVVRLLTTAAIAGIAAWVSYWHMVAVVARYGETDAAPYLIPLSVDGLVVVASICLVELAGGIAASARPDRTTDTAPDNTPDRTADKPKPRPDTRNQRPVVRPAAPKVSTATGARIAAAIAAAPGAGQDAIAAAAKVSARTVRRYLADRSPIAA